jgi:hypothetical protein
MIFIIILLLLKKSYLTRIPNETFKYFEKDEELPRELTRPVPRAVEIIEVVLQVN